MTFAAVAAFTALSPLQAQQLPGRDLYTFPVGTLAEAPALATSAGGGFWNPATISLAPGDGSRLSVAALNTPTEQGIFSFLASAAHRVWPGVTAGVGVAHASVGDLLRTDTDPLSVGSIPYRSTVLSAGLAMERGSAVVGAAVRRRSAAVDVIGGHVSSIDVGAVITRPARLPLKVALSTFLFSPSSTLERTSILGAVEGYLPWTAYDLRAGLSLQRDEGSGGESYAYASGRAGRFDLRGGIARHSAFGATTTRLRLGLGMRYARYQVGIAREDGTAGLGASYQFLLTTTLP